MRRPMSRLEVWVSGWMLFLSVLSSFLPLFPLSRWVFVFIAMMPFTREVLGTHPSHVMPQRALMAVVRICCLRYLICFLSCSVDTSCGVQE